MRRYMPGAKLGIWWIHEREHRDFQIHAKMANCDPLACCLFCSQSGPCMERYEMCLYRHMWE